MELDNSNSEMCNLLYCYKSLLRVRGDAGLEQQIIRLEAEWKQLLDDVQKFIRDIRAMEQDNRLLIGTRFNKNYKNGKLMATYKERKMYIPYLCFRMNRNVNVFKWETVSQLLAEKNATFDEIVLHMWVFRGMRDYYWRANVIAGHIEQLINYQHECLAALELEQIDSKMLPDQMRRIADEALLPGY